MSGMPWFRFYSEALGDRKLARVGRSSGLAKLTVMGAWATLLALANESPERGCLMVAEGEPLTDDEIRAEMELNEEDYERLMAGFRSMGLVHRGAGGRWVITNWEKRNFESDNSTARSKRWRAEKQQAESGKGACGGAVEVREREETATLQEEACSGVGERWVQRGCNGPDTDTDTDTEPETETETDTDAETAPDIEQETDLDSECEGGGERVPRSPASSRPGRPGRSGPAPSAGSGQNGAGIRPGGHGRARARPPNGALGEKSAVEGAAVGGGGRISPGTLGEVRAPAAGSDVPDPARLTVRQIRALELDEAGWQVLLGREETGRRRVSALGHMERMLNKAPPAVAVYQRVVELWPGRALWDEIGRAAGEDGEDLAFWERVVKGYLLCGWNKLNIGTMLEFFRRREVPPGSGGGKAVGAGWIDPVAAARKVIEEQGWD